MAAEPVRWEAAERARDQGSATLTGKVALHQERATAIQPGALMFQAVYRPDATDDTVEDRRANLLGWAYSPLRTRELAEDVLRTIDAGQLQSVLQVEIYDGDPGSGHTAVRARSPGRPVGTGACRRSADWNSAAINGHWW